MKRCGPLRRHTPLRARKPLHSRSRLKRGGRLPRQRKGRIAELERECERLWSDYIKLRYGNKSVLSGVGGPLDAAHLYGRGRLTTKFHPLNGVPLTRVQATYFTENPTVFYQWVRAWWPHQEMSLDELERLSNTITHPTEDWFIEQRDTLRSAIQSLKDARHGCD